MRKEKIKDLYFFHPKTKIQAGEGSESGEFPFYTSSEKLTQRINRATFNNRGLVFGTGGKPSIHLAEGSYSTSTDCYVLSSQQKRVNIKYTFYYLSGNIQILEKGFKGAGLKHVSKKYIEEIEIPYPELSIQNKIVAVLDKVNAIIQKRELVSFLLEELLKATFIDLFGDPIVNPHKWRFHDLKDVALLERGRFSPRPRNDPSYFAGKYPFIQTGDINNSKYRLNKFTQTLNEKGIKVSKEFTIGGIVIAIVGATIGATSILQINAYATDSIIGIKANTKKVNGVFLEMILRFYRQMLLDTAPQAARANINLSILGKLQIIVPPLELQKKYLKFSNTIDASKEKFSNSLDKTKDLFNSILQKAFNGELTFNVDLELNALIEKEDKNLIQSDVVYLQRLIDRLKEQEFETKEVYDKAKNILFAILKEDKSVKQEYDEKLKNVIVAIG